MELLTKFPMTNDEIADMGHGSTVAMPASFDEFWEVLENAEFRADFFDNQIIATMSYETDLHSLLANEIGHLIKEIYSDKTKFRLFNSNRPVFIKGCEGSATGVFNADGMVVPMPLKPFEYRKGMSAETNPLLIIEVLSPNTRGYDFGTKLPCYKNIPTLQHIIYAESKEPKIYFYEKTAPDQWTETTFSKNTDVLNIGGKGISLEKIYQDLYF